MSQIISSDRIVKNFFQTLILSPGCLNLKVITLRKITIYKINK